MSDKKELFTSPDIIRARERSQPIVALGSAVISHDLPYPQNLQAARNMGMEIRKVGAVPAMVAVMDGQIRIGLSDQQLNQIAQSRSLMKVSQRDIAAAVVSNATGGTTVSGTIVIARKLGIRVMAAGGIGGVHRESSHDVSIDLQTLAENPMVVVCAGPNAILDVSATLEHLESMSIPVVGFKTDEFSSFYSRESNLKVDLQLNTLAEIADFINKHWTFGKFTSTVIVVNPVPVTESIPRDRIEPLIEKASAEAVANQIRGQALTPFLFRRVNELTGGKSLRAYLALLQNNACLAAQIACTMEK